MASRESITIPSRDIDGECGGRGLCSSQYMNGWEKEENNEQDIYETHRVADDSQR